MTAVDALARLEIEQVTTSRDRLTLVVPLRIRLGDYVVGRPSFEAKVVPTGEAMLQASDHDLSLDIEDRAYVIEETVQPDDVATLMILVQIRVGAEGLIDSPSFEC